jgi:dTDP-4-dehydrorhamnose 3,5-epimerase
VRAPELLPQPIAGVYLVPLPRFPDSRGWFSEVYRQEWLPGGRPMVQSNLSRSRAGVLRGLHFHRRQADYWWVPNGTILVGLYDLRTGSPTSGMGTEVRISSDDEEGRGLYIPKGVAHGFLAETDVLMHYLVDEYHTGEDEFGVAWDDPDAGILWGTDDPILSERDQKNPSLAEVLRSAPTFQE